ncbi:MAG: bifunctional DNA-formamidopyrimidine glycosylase/DNA-(apurinic or apyrimidinic site) lyase [Candidatus Paceibacteria bacterium]
MPELPEVETVRLQLLFKVAGKTISRVEVHNPKSTGSDKNFAKKLIGQTIDHIDRIGKLLIFSFQGEEDFYMLAHLKMTGQFFFVDKVGGVAGGGHSLSKNDTKNLPNSHTRVSLYFNGDTSLHFNDMRKFGYLKLADQSQMEIAKSRFGQEPIADRFDLENFLSGLGRRKTSIKAKLLDQTFIAGLGNIYVDETLWKAGVLPTRLTNTITKPEAKDIAKHAKTILNKAISVGGTTFQHFADTNGNIGNYTNHLKVFGKQNTPCPRCGTTIQKTRVAGRGTHFCPQCQR